MRLKSLVMDRRAFLGGAGWAAGGVVATSLVPLSVVHAVPGDLPLSMSGEPAANWHVDDICGHWPPYAHPIGYGRPSPTTGYDPRALADPIDHIFLA